MTSGATSGVRRGGSFLLRALAIGIALGYFALTFYLGSTSRALAPQLTFEARDKVFHALGFGLMQWTHWAAWWGVAPVASRPAALVATTLSASFVGALLEIWQAFLPHRTAEWLDFVADSCGAVLAAVLLGWFLRRVSRGRSSLAHHG